MSITGNREYTLPAGSSPSAPPATPASITSPPCAPGSPIALAELWAEQHPGTSVQLQFSFGDDSPLEQIQLSLGHESILTTERYLGVRQSLTDAPCDHLGVEAELDDGPSVVWSSHERRDTGSPGLIPRHIV
jgi:hypothetical protein